MATRQHSGTGTTHKYAVSERSRWQWDHDIRLSEHALTRWDQRVPLDAVSPEYAWEHSVPVPEYALAYFDDVCEVRGRQEAAEARVFHETSETCDTPYQVIFVVKNEVAVTVLRARQIKQTPMRALVDALKPRVEARR